MKGAVMESSKSRFGSARIFRALVAMAIVCGVLSVASPASAAPPSAVDFTVSETLPIGTPGTLIASDIPGCASASVSTADVSVTETRRLTIFRGTKMLDCGAGDTLSLRFVAVVRGCSSTNFGVWRVTGGTGSFDDARGGGTLRGAYQFEGGPGTACENDGVDDRYTGRLRLAS